MSIYFDSITDKYGYVHSIDMLYIEYFCKMGFDFILSLIHSIRDKYPDLNYFENLDKKPCNKYEFYNNQIVIGGIRIQYGKYTDYDKDSKQFRLIPLLQIRFNPNKYAELDWFKELYDSIKVYLSSGEIIKYDYAVDINRPTRSIKVFDSRKEYSFIKGSRYYGQPGKHGNLKIYDKQKELTDKGMKGVSVLTRVEHTLVTKKEPSLENVYILKAKSDDLNFDDLNDTEKAIVEMYLELKKLGQEYDLKLGRKMMKKLQPYLEGSYELLEYGDILSQLLDRIKLFFLQEGDEWVKADDEIMEMFGG